MEVEERANEIAARPVTTAQRYALWSCTMDVATFGTMDFHQVKW
ncbi:hypothetical protein ACFQ8O_19055 [Streptomyces coelicoflavus]